MFALITILLSLFFVISHQFPHNDELPVLGIVGGLEAKRNQFPHQVSFEYNYRHLCGGSIISKNYVLSAAHCTENKNVEMMAIRAGSLERECGGQLIEVKKYINHPLYDNGTYDYDIVILELKTPLKLDNKSVKAIKLPLINEQITAKVAVTSGWGRTEEDSPLLPRKLRFLPLPILDQKLCEKLMKATKQMICAGYLEGGKDTCTCDSGGPLVADQKLIGVVSWGYGCGEKNSPGIYTKVAAVRKWIKDNTKL